MCITIMCKRFIKLLIHFPLRVPLSEGPAEKPIRRGKSSFYYPYESPPQTNRPVDKVQRDSGFLSNNSVAISLSGMVNTPTLHEFSHVKSAPLPRFLIEVSLMLI